MSVAQKESQTLKFQSVWHSSLIVCFKVSLCLSINNPTLESTLKMNTVFVKLNDILSHSCLSSECNAKTSVCTQSLLSKWTTHRVTAEGAGEEGVCLFDKQFETLSSFTERVISTRLQALFSDLHFIFHF